MRRRLGPVRASIVHAANTAASEMAQTGDATRKTILSTEKRVYEVLTAVVDFLDEVQDGSLQVNLTIAGREIPIGIKLEWTAKEEEEEDKPAE